MTEATLYRECDCGGPPQAAHLPNDEAELKAMRDEMRQLHRLTVLGTAAATIAHEYNNLMTPVVGYAKYALDSGDVDLMKKALQMTLKQTSIACAMSDRVLGLAVNEARPVRRTSARDLIDDAIACLCRDLSKDGIVLKTDISDDLHTLVVPEQLQQVLFNLLINAREALQGRPGRITVSAAAYDDTRLAIQVRDNGKGIPSELLDHIFEPFVSSKEPHVNGRRSGVGLGLAVCRDIVRENGGEISVDTAVGSGTTFTIVLPNA